ncbi:nitroreductase family protein [Streptomyces hygroscopicus]|uniref:nitroreductase family protein n=1 Tax=Streptomyces hygroscopicus TaxID=1912 RepID=UPI0007676F7E|nr:nitroreductase family protein [Streptomyces hygroscopicus]
MQPAALDAAILEKLISAAVAAPSMHNTQPWRYRLNPDTVALEVRAAPERGLRYTDPMGRGLSVSAGAAVFNLRVAVAHFGWEPVVRLLPHRSQPDLLATVGLGASPGDGAGTHDDPHPGSYDGPHVAPGSYDAPHVAPGPHDGPHDGPRPGSYDGPRPGPQRGLYDGLYDAIWRRHSSRAPFSGRRLPARVLGELTEAARANGATLRLAAPGETSRLLRLTAEAERRTCGDPRRRAESRDWVRDTGPYGIPPAALGPRDATGRLPMRDYLGQGADGRRDGHPPAAVFESRPAIAVLSTAQDRRTDWLRAGQALEHVLLLATSYGVRASLLHQALEWPDLRWSLSDAHRTPGHVQMLIRLGYGPMGPATPRGEAAGALDGGGPAT